MIEITECELLVDSIKIKQQKSNIISLVGVYQIWDLFFFREYAYIRMRPPYKKQLMRLKVEFSILYGEKQRRTIVGFITLIPFYMPCGVIPLDNFPISALINKTCRITLYRIQWPKQCPPCAIKPSTANFKVQLNHEKVKHVASTTPNLESFNILTKCSNTTNLLIDYINKTPINVPNDLSDKVLINNGYGEFQVIISSQQCRRNFFKRIKANLNQTNMYLAYEIMHELKMNKMQLKILEYIYQQHQQKQQTVNEKNKIKFFAKYLFIEKLFSTQKLIDKLFT